jgi:DHA2 family multidrug resistance protein
MVVAEQLTRDLDPRLMIAAGLGTTGFALYLMIGFTPDVSRGTRIRTDLIQGFGIGCVFVPLSTVAFGTLVPALRTEATGLFNLMRNIGSSIGISLLTYLLARNSATEQSALVEHITPFRQVVRDFAHQLNLASLTGRAALATDRDGAAVAFIDNFKLMMFVSFLAIPLVCLVQRPGRLANDGSLPE